MFNNDNEANRLADESQDPTARDGRSTGSVEKGCASDVQAPMGATRANVAKSAAVLAVQSAAAGLLTVISASVISMLAVVVSEFNETEGTLIEGSTIALAGPQLWLVRIAWIALAAGLALAVAHRAASLLTPLENNTRNTLRTGSLAASFIGAVAAIAAIYLPAVQSFFVEHSASVNSANPVVMSVTFAVAGAASLSALRKLLKMFEPSLGDEPFAHAAAATVGACMVPIPFGVAAFLVTAIVSVFVSGFPAIMYAIIMIVALLFIMITW